MGQCVVCTRLLYNVTILSSAAAGQAGLLVLTPVHWPGLGSYPQLISWLQAFIVSQPLHLPAWLLSFATMILLSPSNSLLRFSSTGVICCVQILHHNVFSSLKLNGEFWKNRWVSSKLIKYFQLTISPYGRGRGGKLGSIAVLSITLDDSESVPCYEF